MPANGETVTLPTSPSIPVGISLGLLKREMAQGERQGQLQWGLGGRVAAGQVTRITVLTSAPSTQGCSLMPRSLGSCTAP